MATKKPVYLTPEGMRRTKEKLKHLTEVKRQELADYMGSAIADGDLRESAAYDEARLLQSANEAEIADLEEIIQRAVIVEQQAGDTPTAQLGAVLTLQDLSNGGEEVNFHLVGTHEADVLENRISDESPLGQQLMGKQPGDKVSLTLGRKTVEYQVKEVQFE